MKYLSLFLRQLPVFAISLTLSISACVTTQKTREQALETEHDRNRDEVRSVWAFYGVALVKWDSEHQESNPVNREAFARGEVAALWEEMKRTDPKLTEDTLDSLVLVKRNGFMREYAWTYLKAPGWPMPNNLRLEAFNTWRQQNLTDHDPNNVLRLIEPQPK